MPKENVGENTEVQDGVQPDENASGTPVEEPWMQAEDEKDEKDESSDETPGGEGDEPPSHDPSKQVPVRKFVKVKKDLRGKISERDEEIERLRKENEALKSKGPTVSDTPLVRPKAESFASEQDFQDALDKYYDDRAAETFQRSQLQEAQKNKTLQAKRAVVQAVEEHYDRAGKLLEAVGINPEVFKNADLTVRTAVEQVAPKSGDIIVDQIISILGDGSEKVMYYLGRNKSALDKFQNLLVVDPTGMKAAVFLGQEKQRLSQPKKMPSNAPNPAPQVRGDSNGSQNGAALKRQYQTAHKKNDSQAAYNAKKAAKAAGIDTKGW